MVDEARQEDLTELGRLRQRVAELEASLGLTRESSADGIVDLDGEDDPFGLPFGLSSDLSDLLSIHAPNGDYVYVSRNTRRFFGWPRDEVIGRNAYDFFHPEDIERIASSHAEHEGGGERNSVRYRMKQADGNYRWVETRSRVQTSNEGVDYIVAITRDIEESVVVEQRLNQFTKIVAHDLRSPLVAVANLAEWLQEDIGDTLTGESARHLELIGERIDFLRGLLEDLLVYARVGNRGVEAESVNLESLVEEIVAASDLPDGIEVHVDTELSEIETGHAPLRQVLANLIQNSAKHHDRDEGRIEVTVQDRASVVEVCVIDDGPGVPTRYQHKVFEIFKSLDSNRSGSGTGMGLALVERLVEAAGGRVRLESPVEDDRGTAICFEWPRDWSQWEGDYEPT